MEEKIIDGSGDTVENGVILCYVASNKLILIGVLTVDSGTELRICSMGAIKVEKSRNKKEQEKTVQVGIKIGKKSIGDLKVENSLKDLDRYVKDLDPNH